MNIAGVLRDYELNEDLGGKEGDLVVVEDFPVPEEDIENLYSPLVQRRRRRLYAIL